MGVDASAVARVVGITTQFKNLRAGGVLFLPQRLALFGQGSSDATYSTTKKRILSAVEAGNTYGFGSPIHNAAREFFPANGDGIGTIPLTVYPLEDDVSGVASTGDVTPSGTATKAAEYRLRINEILSKAFVIPKDYAMATATELTETLGRMFDAMLPILEMPVTVTPTYGTVTSAPGAGDTGDGTCTALSVTGTPRPGDWLLTVNTAVVDGGVWTFTDPNGSVISTTVTQTPAPLGATVFDVGGIGFTITDGAADFIVGDTFTITVPATDLQFVSKWKGASANDIVIEVSQPDPTVGIVFALTQPVGGLVNPAVDAAIAQVGNVWETMALNCLNIDDTVALDAFQVFGDGRWGTLVHKPLVVLAGVTDATVANATVISSARTTDKVNGQAVAPDSKNLPFVVAARQLARMAKVANDNPPTGYAAQKLESLTPGTDANQWDYIQRDAAIKDGSSTVEVVDNVLEIGQVVTFYAPVGEPNPAYRFVRDIVRLQNIIFNLELIFAAPEWAAAPLIPDGQATVNPKARQPKSAKTAVAGLVDGLGLNAIISDPTTAKETITSVIDPGNPNRLNLSLTVALSGNTDIKNVDLNFGFFFAQAA